MNTKYRITLWSPDGSLDTITSKVMTTGERGRNGVYKRIRRDIRLASHERGHFNYFRIESEDSEEHFIGYELMQKYVIIIKWL